MRYLIAILCAAVIMTGCASLFAGADTPQDKLDRVVDGLEAAMAGLDVVDGFIGMDLLTATEQAQFQGGLAKAGQGILESVTAVQAAVARHEADAEALEAVRVEAGALAVTP